MNKKEREKVLEKKNVKKRKKEEKIKKKEKEKGIKIEEQNGKAILTKKKVASADQSGVCPEIKTANIPLGACLSVINGTKITTVAQATQIIRTSPRPIVICFEVATPTSAPPAQPAALAPPASNLTVSVCNTVYAREVAAYPS